MVFSKIKVFVSLVFFKCFWLWFSLQCYYLLLLLYLVYSSTLNVSRWKDRWAIWDLLSKYRYLYLQTLYQAPHSLHTICWLSLSFIFIHLNAFLMCFVIFFFDLFGNILIVFHIFANFLKYLLLLISSFIPGWSEDILDMISIFLNVITFMVLYTVYLGECPLCTCK